MEVVATCHADPKSDTVKLNLLVEHTEDIFVDT